MQSNALQLGYRWGFWRGSFPPWDQPWKLPGWLIGVHVGNTLAYPIGGERGASTATLAALLVGVAGVMAKTPADIPFSPSLTIRDGTGRGRAWAVSLRRSASNHPVPGSVHLFVGGTGRGDPVGPAAVAGIAAAERLGWAVGLLATLGFCLIGRDLVQPYRVPADVTSRSFAHWLWNESSPDAELLCVKSDLGFAFQPELWKRGMSAVYLFHQGTSTHRDRIESRIERSEGPIEPDGLSAWSFSTSRHAAIRSLNVG